MTRTPMTIPSHSSHPKPGFRPRPTGSANTETRTRRTPAPITIHANTGLLMVASFGSLLDDLIRPQQERLRNREPDGLRRLEVDDQLELGRLLDGQVGRLGALQDLVNMAGSTPKEICDARTIAHERTRLGEFT